MTNFLRIATVASLLVLGTAAQAQQQAKSPLYGEIGYTQLKFSSEGETSFKPGVLRGIVGYDLHPNVAVEGMLGFGVKKDDDSKISNMMGVYAKPKFSFGDLEVFGRIGFTRIKAEIEGGDSDTGNDVTFGVGVNYNISRTMNVGVDYMSYYKKEGIKIDGVTIGLGVRF